MATRDIETFGQVHEIGDTRRPWNAGKKTRALRRDEIERREVRYEQRRRRWIAEAARDVGWDTALRAAEACDG